MFSLCSFVRYCFVCQWVKAYIVLCGASCMCVLCVSGDSELVQQCYGCRWQLVAEWFLRSSQHWSQFQDSTGNEKTYLRTSVVGHMGRFIHHIQEQLTLDDWRFTVTVWFSYHDLTPCGRYIKNLKFEPVTLCHLYSSRVANVILFFTHVCTATLHKCPMK